MTDEVDHFFQFATVYLMPDGTVKGVYGDDGREEIWGYWKGKWTLEEPEGEENGNG